MDENMIPALLKGKPINGYFVLVEVWGDINNYVVHNPDKYSNAKNMTNITCVVYNAKTDRYSNKSVYLHKSGRLYMNTRKDGKIWLDEFKENNSEVHGK